MIFDGQRWQTGDDATGPPPATDANTPVAVSCPNTSTCIAVGDSYARTWTR
jgi:hypothetical protein